MMKDLLEKNNLLKMGKIGDIVEGKVIAWAKSSLFLDLGPIGTGTIYGREFLAAKSKIRGLEVGDKLFAKIVDLENEEGFMELSLSGAEKELAWDILNQKLEKGENVKVKVLGANKGGLLAEVSGMPAFLPVSQLDNIHYPRVENGDPQKILRELQKFIGQELEVKIFDLKPRTGEIILSEKAKDAEKIKESLKKYKIGEIVAGEITGLTDFGAFIKFPLPAVAFLPAVASAEEGAEEGLPADLSAEAQSGAEAEAPKKENPELEGLIHISELDWKIVENPSEVAKIGDKVKAKIIDISNNKVSLSLKALKEDPWLDIEKKYKKGDNAEGKITKFNPFGAFVQITPEIQGLCHISEFGSQTKMQKAMELGKTYKFEILLIEPKEHKMSLKLAG